MQIEQLFRLFLSSSGVSTDTRTLQPGALFFALSGPSFDGNRFAAEAIQKGASAAVVNASSGITGDKIVPVSDTLFALQQLAAHYRSSWTCPVVAIGGSNGKTTTKELVASVLSTKYKTFATPGNLNNHIGVPLSILKVDASLHTMVVLELGANHPGEIALLCSIARPTHGYITNIGMDHLEGFGSVEGVLAANAELYDFLAQVKGTAFLNSLHPTLIDKAKGLENQVTFPLVDDAYPIRSLETRVENKLAWGDYPPLVSQLPGAHNFENLAAALAIGLYFHVPYSDASYALATYKPQNNRSQLMELPNGSTLWLDAYNANPSSMEAAIRSAHAYAGDRPLIYFLGDMLELGSYADEAHAAICTLMKELSSGSVYLFGDTFYALKDQFRAFHFHRSIDQAPLHTVFEGVTKGSVILFKGSRGLQMERLAHLLIQHVESQSK